MNRKIESFYADLAIILHWQPSEIDKLNLDDLILFHEMARERSQTEEGS